MIKLTNHVEPKKPIKFFCELPFKRIKINHMGFAFHCCFQSESIGNVLDEDFHKVWNSKISEEVRDITKQGNLHRICSGWGGCPFIGRDIKDETKYEEHLVHKNYPVALEIDLHPSHCNIGGLNPSEDKPACIMCPRNSKKLTEHPSFNINVFDKVLDKVSFLMPYLKELTILGVAEPFWKNIIFDTFDKLKFKEHRDHCMFWTYTNGTVFGPKIQDKYKEYVKKSELSISIDAATPETYMKIRRLDFYDTIKRNVTHYSRNRCENHLIKICHNINKINFKELPHMVEEASEMGADVVYFNFTHTAGNFIDISDIALRKDDKPDFEKYEKKAYEISKKNGITIEMFRSFDQNLNQPISPTSQ